MSISDCSAVPVRGLPEIHSSAGTVQRVRIAKAFTDGVSEPLGIRTESRIRVDRGRPSLEATRAAYLLAFAAFGWRYICQPTLDPLRLLFRGSYGESVRILTMTDYGAHPTRRQLWVVREPDERRCVIVAYGERQVFLPMLNDPRTLEDLSLAYVRIPTRQTWRAAPL
jgi:hypothetical protein